MLLYGPPGTGKTLLAKAVANESGATFYSQSASAFVEMFAGLGAVAHPQALRSRRARTRPSIVFIDELDAVGAARTGTASTASRTRRSTSCSSSSTASTRATRSWSWARRTGSRISTPRCSGRAASTGRCSSAPPDLNGREAILRVHTRGKPLAADVDLEWSRARRPASPAPTSRTSRTRRRSSPAASELQYDRHGALRRRDGARRRRAPAAAGRHREGEADPRLPRGRPRAACRT